MNKLKGTHKCDGCKWFQWLTPGVCGHAKLHEDCYEPKEQRTYSLNKVPYMQTSSTDETTVIERNNFETNKIFNN